MLGLVIERLASLFQIETKTSIWLIKTLMKTAFIAGESIVWTLTDDETIPTKIDLFVNDPSSVDGILSLLSPYTSSGPDIRIVCVDTGFEETVDRLDMDYLQCGIHKEQIYMSVPCIEAHKKKEVSLFFGLPSKDDLEKALSKGFKVPYFDLDPEGRTGIYQRPKLVGVGKYKGVLTYELDVGNGMVYATHISLECNGLVHIFNVQGEVVERDVGYLPLDIV